MSECDAAIVPFPVPATGVGAREVRCKLPAGHDPDGHAGTIPGTQTALNWMESDRRNYHGTYPGMCPLRASKQVGAGRTSGPCILPTGHRGNCDPG